MHLMTSLVAENAEDLPPQIMPAKGDMLLITLTFLFERCIEDWIVEEYRDGGLGESGLGRLS